MMKKRTILTVICSIICAIATIFAAGSLKISANAEGVSSVSVKAVSSGSTTVDYVYIYFEGFNTKVGYDEPGDGDDYAFRNIYINGTSIHDINKNTDVSDWSWDVYPQTEQPGYRKPVIHYIGTTGSTNKYMEIRIHKNFTQSVLESDGYFHITVAEGFTINGYTIDKETTYALNGDKYEKVLPEADITSSLSVEHWVDQNELNVTYLNLGTGVIPEKADYGVTFGNYAYVQDYILINGRKISEINADTTLGASEWNYTVFPATADAKYKIPVILFAKTTVNDVYSKDTVHKIEIKIHDNYLALLGNKVEITVKEGLSFAGSEVKYVVKTTSTFTAWEQVVIEEIDITENITIEGWNTAGDKGELTYTRLSLGAGVLPAGLAYDIMDKAPWKYIQEYITINGKTVKEINEQTDTSSYEFSTFPYTLGGVFGVPVVLYLNGDKLEIKVHNDYVAVLGNVDIVIGVKEGLTIDASVPNTVNKVVNSVETCVNKRTYVLTVTDGENQVEIDVKHGNALNLEDSSRVGYTFGGWFEVGTDEALLAVMPTRDYSVYAKYTAIEYVVTFMDGETVVGTDTYTVEDTQITVPEVPAKDGYNGVWEEYALTTGDVTVNTVYTAIEYTVTFMDGETVVGTETYTVENTQITVPEVPAKDGYVGAWDEFELTMGDVTVNAVYTVIEYTVTFMDGETVVGTDTYTVEDTQITVPEVPAKDGYTSAWDAYELTTGDITVNTVYTAIEYTVTFMAGETVVATQTYTVENTEITEPEVPAKDGYAGAWESYDITIGDLTVNAVYTKIEESESNPEESATESEETESETQESVVESTVTSEKESASKKPSSGCMGSVGGTGLAFLALAAVALIRKKSSK